MALTYTWEIRGLRKAAESNGLNNVILDVHWRKTGVNENGVSAYFDGSTPLPVPTSDDFTPYEQLTKEQVISWLPTVIGDYENHINHMIDLGIEAKLKNESEVVLSPWGERLDGAV